jgi:hypothetical protein
LTKFNRDLLFVVGIILMLGGLALVLFANLFGLLPLIFGACFMLIGSEGDYKAVREE